LGRSRLRQKGSAPLCAFYDGQFARAHFATGKRCESASRIYRLIKAKKLAAINIALPGKRPMYRIPPDNVIRK